MSDHIYRIKAIGEWGLGSDLECVGHDKDTCALQSWWENVGEGLLDLKALDIPILVRAEWNNSDEPTIVLAAVDPATAVGVFDIAKHLREAHDTLHQFADRIDEFVWGELDAVLNPDSWDTTAADPAVTITWDGSDEVLGEIARLFPTSTLYPHTHIQGRNAFGDIRIVDYARYPKTGSAGILVLGGRIRIEGDSFAILPPKEEQS